MPRKLDHARHNSLQRADKAMKSKAKRVQGVDEVWVRKAWHGLGDSSIDAHIGFFIWAVRKAGFSFLESLIKRARTEGLEGRMAFESVRRGIYSRLRDTA